MPKPVFQKTSGYLPQGFVKDIQTGADDQGEAQTPDELSSRQTAEASEPSATGHSAPAVAAPAIEPQPDLSELFISEDPGFATAPEPPKKSGGVRPPMIVLGLIAILAFVAFFLAVIYFLFLKGPGGSNNF